MRTLTALMLTAMLACTASQAQQREEINLSGQWQYVMVDDLAQPPADGWQTFEVPGLLRGVDYQRAWFRREFEVPSEMAGGRILLHFGGVKFNSTVRVNGQTVGGHFGGHEAFEVDITEAARVGETNLLELGCHDWTGVFIDDETDFSILRERPVRSRSIPKDKILAPIGGLNEQFGPWDDVYLRSRPAVAVTDVFVRPSVRNQALVVEYTLGNATEADATVLLRARVEDGGDVALVVGERSVQIPAGGSAEVTLEAPWTDARYWSHEDPHLYHLRTRLVAGDETVDELRTRFGFREFWIDGRHYYLNGKRVSLRATSWWPPRDPLSRDEIERQLQGIRDLGCVIFRTHTQPWRQIWYDTADEMGVMMVPEGAIWNDDTAYRIDDPRFWENYAEHLRAMAHRTRNNPSVVMYSLENEMYGSRLNEDSPAMADLARMGEMLRQYDPTRPIYYESDGDPMGVADAVGIHYPHEYPEYVQWPNTAYWMNEPEDINAFDGEDWLWDRRKPLYIGEYLWIPSSDPSWHTVFFGDEAYLDYEGYAQRAKAMAWRMATQAYRYYEVGAMSPWTVNADGILRGPEDPLFAAQQWAMDEHGAYVREWDHNFHGGESVTRTFDVYNDSLTEADLVFGWSLRGEDVALSGERELWAMRPAERRPVQITLEFPPVRQRVDVTFRVSVHRDGREVFADQRQYSIFPALVLQAPEGVRVGVYDPSGTTASKLSAAGLQFDSVPDLMEPDCDVLVIGANAWRRDERLVPVIGGGGAEAALAAFVRHGGRVLVLEQQHYPPGMIGAQLTAQGSTMVFPQMPEHPVLAGLRPLDLKWWRPDNIVTRAEPARPISGGNSIVVSGSRAGIAHAPLLELPSGAGTMLLSQMLIAERLGREPAAGLLLQNALTYLAQFQPRVARTALYCPSAATREVLDRIGLDAREITEDPSAADWSQIELLIACGPLEGLAEVRPQIEAMLARGGSVLLHGVTPMEFEALEIPGAAGLDLVPHHGAATRVPGAHELSAYFANEDLYWLGEARAPHSWATKPLSSEMTSFILGRSLRDREVVEHSWQQMRLEGSVTGVRDGAVHLSSGGATASVDVRTPEAGQYIIGVEAGGTQADGVWPAGAILVDGERFGQFACQEGEFAIYTAFGHLEAGEHIVTVRFTNDAYNPPEDRNLFVRSIIIARDEPIPGVTYLTSPPAVAVFEGTAGRVILDNINWDTTESNTRKADRYISGLLAGLGAPFRSATGTVIEAESLAHDPTMKWYRRDAGSAYLGDSGWIEGPVEVARAGSYVLRIFAGGTPAEGTYPIVAISVDGREVGQIQLRGEAVRGYPLEVGLSQGRHVLRLTFTNDLHAPPEDRNLTIDRIQITRAPAG